MHDKHFSTNYFRASRLSASSEAGFDMIVVINEVSNVIVTKTAFCDI